MTIKLEKKFTLRPLEIKCFPVTVLSDCDATVMGRISGLSDCACISTAGKNYLGEPTEYPRTLKAGEERRLWFYLRAEEKCGSYDASLAVCDMGGKVLCEEALSIKVCGEPCGDEQFENASELKRLYWLNSDYAINDEIPKPFIPVKLTDRTLDFLGRRIAFADSGLPAEVSTFYSQSVSLSDEKTDILSAPISFSVDGESLEPEGFEIKAGRDGAEASALSESEVFKLSVSSRTEFDGFSDFKITLCAKRDAELDDARLVFPVSDYARKYFMGLGREGGLFSGELDWKWNPELQQDSFWVGNVNAGIRVKLKGSNYVKPLVNIYYSYKPLNMPDSWYNGGLGGIKYENGCFVCYCGKRTLKAGESLSFDFEMITTPIKPIDLERHFNMRIFHKPPAEHIDLNDSKSANIVNIHHGNDLNPYINYPFFENEALSEFIDEAHARDMRVKLYYTIRELTVHLPEFRALQDLDTEIFEAPAREVDPSYLWQTETLKWIRENVGENLIPAWRQKLNGRKYKDSFDSSVITDGQSRLCNFYVEGLRHLVEFFKIDGIYVDDVAYDRNTMKRVRKTLDAREGALIDFHTWNHYTGRAGFTNCFNLYTELLPYIDKMWVGEGFDYNMSPDYWLVEISGIPFGLMSEMMCEGQPWRGLLFGMTTRLSWVPEADPTNIWELYDEYSLGKAELIGPWDSRNNVRLSNPAATASLYVNGNKKYIALANWSDKDISTDIELIGEGKHTFSAPRVRDFQEAASFDGKISIPAGKGYFLVVE